uniref:LijH n=1 Tax=Ascomycota sp. F53 TaxID=1168013 RepID=A0A140CZC4_9ASCO|nr:lijH [Ascomycota sp. F53]
MLPLTTSSATTYFFTFGDSYSQTGFNVTLDKPSAANPLGNPTYPGWTTTGGPNWIGYLTAKYNSSLVYSYNFAYGGATTDATLVAPYEPTVLSFIDQVAEFTDSVASKPDYAPWSADDSLFGIWLGVNDVGNSWWEANETARIGQIMDQYFNQTNILYEAGGRNFAFLGVPPIQRAPTNLVNDQASRDAEAAVITEYNDALSQRAQAFASNRTDIKVYVVDTQEPFNVVLDNPGAFGAANATCYDADGLTCLWFNDYHPGQAIHDLVASKFASVYDFFSLRLTWFVIGFPTRSVRVPVSKPCI